MLRRKRGWSSLNRSVRIEAEKQRERREGDERKRFAGEKGERFGFESVKTRGLHLSVKEK